MAPAFPVKDFGMGGPYQILIPLLSLLFVRVDLTDLWPLQYPVQVVKILDGDTLVLRINRRIINLRLSRIDAPEKGQPFINQKGDAGLESKKCLARELQKKSRLEVAIEGHDIYKRVLGDISELSLDLVRNGCASLYPYATFHSQREKFTYLRALSHAKSKRLGLWSRGGYVNPKIWRKLHRHQRK